MRQLVLVMILATAARAADTPAGEFTRTTRLAAKVTLTAKNLPLKTVLEQISNQLEANKLGRLRFDIAPVALSLIPATVSVEVKDAPLSEALAMVLGPAGLDVKVISSEIDPKDGWLRIVKGEPKAAGPAATEAEEKDARVKLDAAKAAIVAGQPADAKFLLTFVLKKYPTATAAAEAKTLLETLRP